MSLDSHPPSFTDRPARRVLIVVTLTLAACALGFVGRFGSFVPVADEWDALVGYRQARAAGMILPWIVESHNEHRYPAARFLYAASLELSRFDVRGPMLLSGIVLAAASVLFTAAARIARGFTSFGDVLIPALLLNWGHAFNLLMGYQLAFSLFVLAMSVLTWAACRGSDAAAGAGALLLAASGGPGVAVTLPVAMWLGVRRWSGPPARRLAGLGLMVALLLYAGWATGQAQATPPDAHMQTAPKSVGRFLLIAGQFLATGAGLSVFNHWHPAAVMALLGSTLAAVWLGNATRRGPASAAAAGFFALMLGLILMALSVAWKRDGGLAARYVTLAATGPVVAWVALASTRRISRWLTACAVLLAVMLVGTNLRAGTRYGQNHRLLTREFITAVRAGDSPRFLVGRFQAVLFDRPEFADRLHTLQTERLGIFTELAADVPLTSRPVEGFRPAPITFGQLIRFPDPPRAIKGLELDLVLGQHLNWLELRTRGITPAGPIQAGVFGPLRPGPHTVTFRLPGNVSGLTLTPTGAADNVQLLAARWLIKAD